MKLPFGFEIKKTAEIQANLAEGSFDPKNLVFYEWNQTQLDEYTSYESQVIALMRRYDGLSTLGRELTKSIIDTRVSWIAGNGINVDAKGTKEKEFLTKFVEYNKLNSITFREFATRGELEGKVLMLPTWDSSDKMVDVKYISWLDSRYKITTDGYDYESITRVTYRVDNKEYELTGDEVVFALFGGFRRYVLDTPPRCGAILFNIDACSSAIRDLRKINRKFGAAFPVFETESMEDAADIMEAITNTKWKIGQTIAGKFKAKYLEPAGTGLDSIIKEIQMHFRFISNVSGIPVFFFDPSLMSNRATAQELMEMVNSATVNERENWKVKFTELCKKAMKLYTEKTGEMLDYDDVTVSIPAVSMNQIQSLVDIYLPLADAGIISKKTLREKVPDIDPEVEEQRIKQEQGSNTPPPPRNTTDILTGE